MNLASISFLAFVAVTVIAFHLWSSVQWRRCVLGVANAAFIASYLTDLTQILPLLGFLALGYGGLLLVRLRRTGLTLAFTVACILAVYIVLKRFSFIEPYVHLPMPYLLIGLSYILFRVIHLIVDAGSGDVPEQISPFAYFRYTCNFLCFVSGPIQRYQDFARMDGTEVAPLDADRVYGAFARIITGYIKFVVVAASADYFFINFDGLLIAPVPQAWGHLVLVYAASAVAYTFYLYYNFSGYMDIVLGLGLLLGQELPENFNKPFNARSFLEFWQRWHMTLSDWFKLYLFNPLMFALMTRFPAAQATAYLGVLAFFVTFLVMGVWHGTTLVFVIYGLLMGFGASANKLWQIACTKRLGKKRYRALSQTTLYSSLARGLTASYFALALTCLWVPALPDFIGLTAKLGAFGLGAVLLCLTVTFAIAGLVLDRIATLFGRVMPAWQNRLAYPLPQNLLLGGRILAILAIASLFNKPPDFVYKAF